MFEVAVLYKAQWTLPLMFWLLILNEKLLSTKYGLCLSLIIFLPNNHPCFVTRMWASTDWWCRQESYDRCRPMRSPACLRLCKPSACPTTSWTWCRVLHCAVSLTSRDSTSLTTDFSDYTTPPSRWVRLWSSQSHYTLIDYYGLDVQNVKIVLYEWKENIDNTKNKTL